MHVLILSQKWRWIGSSPCVPQTPCCPCIICCIVYMGGVQHARMPSAPLLHWIICSLTNRKMVTDRKKKGDKRKEIIIITLLDAFLWAAPLPPIISHHPPWSLLSLVSGPYPSYCKPSSLYRSLLALVSGCCLNFKLHPPLSMSSLPNVTGLALNHSPLLVHDIMVKILLH